MSHLASDLEEGEILDDSPSSPYCISNATKNHKQLPRRYVLHENKSTHKNKHKKNCRYANSTSNIRYHARKLAKLKKTSKLKDCHKKSCSHKNIYIPDTSSSSRCDKSVIKHSCPKNGHTHHNHTVDDKIKNPLKQHNVYKHSSKLSKSEKSRTEVNIEAMTNRTFSEMLILHKSMQTHQKNTDDSIKQHNHVSQNSVETHIDVTNIPKSDFSEKIVNCTLLESSEANLRESEDEDEEELRRIALATCAKRVPDMKPLSEISDSAYIVPESSENKLLHIPYHENSNDASDNYDVIDMDLDEEEVQNNIENSENNLFVIDAEPQTNYQNFQKNPPLQAETVEDEEFNTDILRAELLNNLLHKRKALENVFNIESSDNVKGNSKSLPQKISNVVTHPDKQVINNDSNNSPKRLVISLKEESSSSEESGGEEEKANSNSDCPVDSIVALISDIRQKSDSSEKNGDQVNSVPGAVSCLSKAQQQEYNSLIKILEKKKTVPGKNQGTIKTAHSPLSDLKSLEKKLLAVRVTLNKKKELMSCLSKEADANKFVYMKSKLTAQHLKNKYIAAEKVRRIKLQVWSKSCKNYDSVQKSVSSLESKITQLQNLCSKIGASIKGQNYNLPTKRE